MKILIHLLKRSEWELPNAETDPFAIAKWNVNGDFWLSSKTLLTDRMLWSSRFISDSQGVLMLGMLRCWSYASATDLSCTCHVTPPRFRGFHRTIGILTDTMMTRTTVSRSGGLDFLIQPGVDLVAWWTHPVRKSLPRLLVATPLCIWFQPLILGRQRCLPGVGLRFLSGEVPALPVVHCHRRWLAQPGVHGCNFGIVGLRVDCQYGIRVACHRQTWCTCRRCCRPLRWWIKEGEMMGYVLVAW